MKENSSSKEYVCNETQHYESFKNHHNTENHFNNTHFDKSNDSNSSNSKVSATFDNSQKNYTELIEEVTLSEFENSNFLMKDNIQKITTDDVKFELSEEFDDYILVENINAENPVYDNDNENELHQLLVDYDTVNEKMIQQFQSNPKYFTSAIKTYTLAMKNNLTSKESLSAVLNSFGKY